MYSIASNNIAILYKLVTTYQKMSEKAAGKRKGGPEPKSAEDKQSEVGLVYMTKKVKAALTKGASDRKMKFSAFMQQCALEKLEACD
jgi:hypothetical protein